MSRGHRSHIGNARDGDVSTCTWWLLSLEMWLKLKAWQTKAVPAEVLNNFCPLSFMLWILSIEAILWKTCTQIRIFDVDHNICPHVNLIWLCFDSEDDLVDLTTCLFKKKISDSIPNWWKDSACGKCIMDLNLLYWLALCRSLNELAQ